MTQRRSVAAILACALNLALLVMASLTSTAAQGGFRGGGGGGGGGGLPGGLGGGDNNNNGLADCIRQAAATLCSCASTDVLCVAKCVAGNRDAVTQACAAFATRAPSVARPTRAPTAPTTARPTFAFTRPPAGDGQGPLDCVRQAAADICGCAPTDFMCAVRCASSNAKQIAERCAPSLPPTATFPPFPTPPNNNNWFNNTNSPYATCLREFIQANCTNCPESRGPGNMMCVAKCVVSLRGQITQVCPLPPLPPFPRFNRTNDGDDDGPWSGGGSGVNNKCVRDLIKNSCQGPCANSTALAVPRIAGPQVQRAACVANCLAHIRDEIASDCFANATLPLPRPPRTRPPQGGRGNKTRGD